LPVVRIDEGIQIGNGPRIPQISQSGSSGCGDQLALVLQSFHQSVEGGRVPQLSQGSDDAKPYQPLRFSPISFQEIGQGLWLLEIPQGSGGSSPHIELRILSQRALQNGQQ
jgi:hypothetical protein